MSEMNGTMPGTNGHGNGHSSKAFGTTKRAAQSRTESASEADTRTLKVLHRVQAIIEFELDGTIRAANENFTNTVGYSLSEIQGAHHRMFVVPAEANSPDYQRFWSDLRAG